MTHSREFPNAAELSACPICASENITHYLDCRDRHYGIQGVFATAICKSCGLVFLNPMLTPSQLSGLYPDGYYSYQPPKLEANVRSVAKRILRLKRDTLLPNFARPGTLLDVGCGAGQYLLDMKSRGWRVYGSELSKAGTAAGRSEALDIREGELMNAGFPDNMFDFVRSNHSLEHMPDPRTVLLEMRRLLKNDGVLVIGVPNIDGLIARWFNQYWWNFGVPVHTYNFNAKNLGMLLEQCGFRVEKIRYYSDYSSLLGSIQIWLNRKNRIGDATGAVLQSWILRLPAQMIARFLDFLRLGDCIELQCRKA